MPTKFDDYIREIEEKIKAEGPETVARWEAFNTHFAMARDVRELRKERHLTQKQLAAASGISPAEISRIERGQTNPTAVPSLPYAHRWEPARESSSARAATSPRSVVPMTKPRQWPLSGSEAALLNVLGMARRLWQNSASTCVEH